MLSPIKFDVNCDKARTWFCRCTYFLKKFCLNKFYNIIFWLILRCASSPLPPQLINRTSQLDSGTQNWGQHSRWALYQCWVEGKDPSLTYWKNSSQCNPRPFFSTRAHCSLTFNLLSSRTPRSFPAKLLSRSFGSKCGCVVLFLSRFKTLHFHQSNSERFLSALSKCDTTLWFISRSSQSRQTSPGH